MSDMGIGVGIGCWHTWHLCTILSRDKMFKELVTHHCSLCMAWPFLSPCFYSELIFMICHKQPMTNHNRHWL